MRIALLGFGQIGGSIALALERRRPDWTLAGWSPSGDGPGRAAAEGVLERSAASLADAVGDANIVVLAAPPLASIDLLDQLAATALPSGAIVTDVCSTKRRIVDRAASLGLPFVGGHPMAGREASGYASADADLFVDRPWVICPDGDVGAAT
ncbi:MAG TPA: prephenate dehydrogenase/arogenate dehydrogenase family protein, partial [Vitreimonas sp.]|nr:prephenate dehydrogenase/arogenate dehydrogenase family protein [Vitreimonas sp.]